MKRKTAKAKAIGAAVRTIKPRVKMLEAWADAAHALAALRNDTERAHVLSAFFPLMSPAALRYLQRRLTVTLSKAGSS
jgi:hypothetical protein